MIGAKIFCCCGVRLLPSSEKGRGGGFCRAVLLWTTSRPRGCRSSLQTGEKQHQLHADQFNHKRQSRWKTKALPELLAMPGRQQHLGPLLKTALLMRAPMLGWNPGLPTSLLLMCWVNWPTSLCVCCCRQACVAWSPDYPAYSWEQPSPSLLLSCPHPPFRGQSKKSFKNYPSGLGALIYKTFHVFPQCLEGQGFSGSGPYPPLPLQPLVGY